MKKDFNTGLRKGIEADRVKLTRRRKLLLREMGGQPHTMASQHFQSHSCVPVVCIGFVQGTKKSKQQSNSPCCQLHLQRLYVYGAHVTNRSKSFILDLGH